MKCIKKHKRIAYLLRVLKAEGKIIRKYLVIRDYQSLNILLNWQASTSKAIHKIKKL